jgi:hypothetical protein
MIVIISGRSPRELELVRVPVDVDGHIQNSRRRKRSGRNLDRVNPERIASQDPLKRSELLVDDRVVLVQIGVLATGSTPVT